NVEKVNKVLKTLLAVAVTVTMVLGGMFLYKTSVDASDKAYWEEIKANERELKSGYLEITRRLCSELGTVLVDKESIKDLKTYGRDGCIRYLSKVDINPRTVDKESLKKQYEAFLVLKAVENKRYVAEEDLTKIRDIVDREVDNTFKGIGRVQKERP